MVWKDLHPLALAISLCSSETVQLFCPMGSLTLLGFCMCYLFCDECLFSHLIHLRLLVPLRIKCSLCSSFEELSASYC